MYWIGRENEPILAAAAVSTASAVGISDRQQLLRGYSMD
jgi:hypothetical protein